MLLDNELLAANMIWEINHWIDHGTNLIMSVSFLPAQIHGESIFDGLDEIFVTSRQDAMYDMSFINEMLRNVSRVRERNQLNSTHRLAFSQAPMISLSFQDRICAALLTYNAHADRQYNNSRLDTHVSNFTQ